MVPKILGSLSKNSAKFGSFQTLDNSNCRSEEKLFCLFPSKFVNSSFLFSFYFLFCVTFCVSFDLFRASSLFCLLGTRWHCPSYVQNCDRAWSPRVLHQQTTRRTRVLYAFAVHCRQSTGTFLKISLWHGL